MEERSWSTTGGQMHHQQLCKSNKEGRKREKERPLSAFSRWHRTMIHAIACCIPQMRHYGNTAVTVTAGNTSFLFLSTIISFPSFCFPLFILYFTLYQSRRKVSRHDGLQNNNCHLQHNSLKQFNVAAFQHNFYN